MPEINFEKIKDLIRIIGGRVIVVENGKPLFVITDIEEYLDFQKIKDSAIGNLSKRNLIEKINSDINVWKNKQEEKKIKQIESNLETERKENGKISDEIIIEKL